MLRMIPKKLLIVMTLLHVTIHCKNKYDATIVGILNPADGLGNVTVGILKCLKDYKINWISTRRANFDFNDLDSHLKKIANNQDERPAPVAIFTDIPWDIAEEWCQHVPKHSLIKIAYSMLESSLIPQQWVDIFNGQFDAIVVPDKFHVRTYRKSGVSIPIFILPIPLSLQPFFDKPLKSLPKKPFIFGNLAGSWVHKNQLGLIEAFAKAFGNSSSVKLVMNSRGCDPIICDRIKKKIKHLRVKNITFKNKRLTNQEYIDLMHSFDCYVNLSKGEGFSISPRESLAMGIPAIISDNSAHHTICQSGHVRCVRAEKPEVAIYDIFDQQCGNFFNCSVHDAAAALKDVYNNYELYLKKAAAGREWVKQYLHVNLEKKYGNLVNPTKVILNKQNKITDSYIMTNSRTLYKKYRRIQQQKH